MKQVALVAENLCKTYGKGDTVVHALNDVSLTLHSAFSSPNTKTRVTSGFLFGVFYFKYWYVTVL